MTQELRISQINIYPVKSLGGITLEEARLEKRGLALDRRWMLVDGQGVFLSQRNHPLLSRVSTTVTPEGIRLAVSHSPGETALIPFIPPFPAHVRVRIWDDEVDAVSVSPELDAWVSRITGIDTRLVMLPDSSHRKVDPAYAHAGEIVSFADGYPLLLTTDASLNDLNSRLSSPVTMKRFRPNLVISGAAAFEEDQWAEISVRSIPLRLVKPCARCVMITIDPDTAQKGPEPLRTLASYRKNERNKVLFGQNILPGQTGTIRTGDLVTIVSRKS